MDVKVNRLEKSRMKILLTVVLERYLGLLHVSTGRESGIS